jgi:creatinine amidohydrolase/Fe(II)-dependent formamide hydrolase-like protein
VITTNLVTALPVTSTERHNPTAAHATAAVAHGAVVTTMRRRGHHSRRSVAIPTSIVVVATSHIVRGASTDGGE